VRHGGVAISRLLEEQLFRDAEVLSEGELRRLDQRDSYFGSTMIAFELARIAGYVVGRFDDQTHHQLLSAIDGSVRMRIRGMRLACAEAGRRVPDRPLGTAQVEIRTRLTATHLHMDIDLEVPLGVSSRARRR
jgi:hypothetical protein